VIRLGQDHLAAIERHALATSPEEACGLLIGKMEATGIEVLAVEPTANVAPDRRRHFEIDPARHLALQRSLRGTGHSVVGAYHSHPGGQAEPSARDAAEAIDPELVWLILGLKAGKTTSIGAYRLVAPGGSFAKVELKIGERA